MEHQVRVLTGGKVRQSQALTTVSGEWVRQSFGADSLFFYPIPAEIMLYQVISGKLTTPELEQIRETAYPHCILVRLSTAEGYYQELALFLPVEGTQEVFSHLKDLSGHICLDRGQMRRIWQTFDPLPASAFSTQN
ncbi:MAG: hypothetical protein IJ654_02905 [Bacteroidales bacterium]|nr:hypothetical protein [Bacteroidales bacterium]